MENEMKSSYKSMLMMYFFAAFVAIDFLSIQITTSEQMMEYFLNIPSEFTLNFNLTVFSLSCLYVFVCAAVELAFAVGRIVNNIGIYLKCRKTYRLYTPVVNK